MQTGQLGKAFLAILGACAYLLCGAQTAALAAEAAASASAPEWKDDLAPIAKSDWNYERAAHLLERAGFGGTPAEIEHLAALSPTDAVRELVHYQKIDNAQLPAFDHSGVHDPGLEPFPVSRPAATEQARANGEALGVKVKSSGNRRMQPVADKFFYWLRASRLETNRVVYWWADRMLNTRRPLEERMALFWHGHFATSEEKVRDYRKMLVQLDLLRNGGTGNFRTLLVGVAQDPAMLAFLDAGVNLKGAPNENFAREIMELFTMGPGNYTEVDIREAARAFTGWNFKDLTFVVNREQHDDAAKRFLGREGPFDGVKVVDIILEQPVTAEFIAAKLYKYFVREDLSSTTRQRLAAELRKNNYEIAPLLELIFSSRDFYSPPSIGTHIKSPVELAVSTYKKLGLKEIPGVPDFNEATSALGQQLLRPPTVAGWGAGRSWITPGLLLERGNFARSVLFPDINFIPPDRYPGDKNIRIVADKVAQGVEISAATLPEAGEKAGEPMAMSNKMADRDEDFNTRFASYHGWQMAIQKVKPIPRATAQLDLTAMAKEEGLRTSEQTVDYFVARFLRVPVSAQERARLIGFLDNELGTSQLQAAETYLEEPLRMLLHLIMSMPEYQLG